MQKYTYRKPLLKNRLIRSKFQPTEPFILPIPKRQQQNKLYKFKIKPPTNHTQTNPKNGRDQTF